MNLQAYFQLKSKKKKFSTFVNFLETAVIKYVYETNYLILGGGGYETNYDIRERGGGYETKTDSNMINKTTDFYNTIYL